MKTKEFLTIAELAKILNISRIAVFNKIKKGQIKAQKIGRNYFISKDLILGVLGAILTQDQKKQIEAAVKKTVEEYGETLKLLGRE